MIKSSTERLALGELAIVTICLLLGGFSIAEALVRLAAEGAQSFPIARLLVRYPAIGLFPFPAVVAFICAQHRWKGILVLLLSATIVICVVIQFRGVYTWPGTFDGYWLSPSGWTFGALLGLLAGGLIGLAKQKHPIMISTKAAVASLCVVVLCSSIAWMTERVIPLDSVYAETRTIAVAGIVIALSFSLFLEVRQYEESV